MVQNVFCWRPSGFVNVCAGTAEVPPWFTPFLKLTLVRDSLGNAAMVDSGKLARDRPTTRSHGLQPPSHNFLK